MSGFLNIDFNHLAGGLEHGAVKGLQHILDAAKDEVWAIESGNADAIAAIADVQKQFILELGGTAGTILPSVVGALIMGGNVDPFQGSRQLLEQFESNFGKH